MIFKAFSIFIFQKAMGLEQNQIPASQKYMNFGSYLTSPTCSYL